MIGGTARVLGAIVGSFAFWSAPLPGQVHVLVQTMEGRPIAGVQVDVWGAADRLGTFATDGGGRVRLEASTLAAARRVSFSHLGFRTFVAPKEEVEQGLPVRLERRPVEISGLTVSVEADPCARPPTADARLIWESAASRYARDTGTLETRAEGLIASGMRRQPELFDTDESGLQPTSVYWAPAAWPPEPGMFTLLEETVRREGYATRPKMGQVLAGGRHLNWVYPHFDGRHAYHFVTGTFGELHDFRVVTAGPHGSVLAFCPNGALGELPAMRGTLAISADGLLGSAEWRFTATDPDEGAGGEVIFMSFLEPGEVLPHLVPARGLFFRHSGRGPSFAGRPRDYYYVLRINTSWRVQPDSR